MIAVFRLLLLAHVFGFIYLNQDKRISLSFENEGEFISQQTTPPAHAKIEVSFDIQTGLNNFCFYPISNHYKNLFYINEFHQLNVEKGYLLFLIDSQESYLKNRVLRI